MTVLYVLIPLGLVLLVAAVAAFFWAVGAGQFDDMDTPAWRVVMDDDRAPPTREPEEPEEAEEAEGEDER